MEYLIKEDSRLTDRIQEVDKDSGIVGNEARTRRIREH